MLDTGFPRADVENDFLRARRHPVLAALAHRLRRQSPDSILSLDEVAGPLGIRGEVERGAPHELDVQRGLHVQQVIEAAEADLLGAQTSGMLRNEATFP